MIIVNDNGIQRPMTDDEQAAYEAFVLASQAEHEQAAAEEAARIAAAASGRAKLAALGLTDEEIDALVGR